MAAWGRAGSAARGRSNLAVGAVLAAVFAVAVLALAGVLSVGGSAEESTGALRAIVHDGEGGVYGLPLDEDAVLEVSTSLGENVVVVEDGAVYVSEADCDGQDCVHQGAIEAPGRQIICLPHKLWIEVVAAGQAEGAMDVEAVAGGSGDGESLDAVAR